MPAANLLFCNEPSHLFDLPDITVAMFAFLVNTPTALVGLLILQFDAVAVMVRPTAFNALK